MDKKHEDVALVAQIDKTSVFQEGTVHWENSMWTMVEKQEWSKDVVWE